MLAKFRFNWFFLVLVALMVTSALFPFSVSAQFFSESGQDDGFVESDDKIFEDEERQGGYRASPGLPGTPQQSTRDDYTEGGRFVDEERSLAPSRGGGGETGGVTIDRRQTQLRIQGEKQQLPLNAAWGAGTGLLIGSWLALIEAGNDRQTQRFIGMGVVLGAGLGAVLGMKTLIVPGAPRAALAEPPPATRGLQAMPLVALGTTGPGSLLLGVSLRF